MKPALCYPDYFRRVAERLFRLRRGELGTALLDSSRMIPYRLRPEPGCNDYTVTVSRALAQNP